MEFSLVAVLLAAAAAMVAGFALGRLVSRPGATRRPAAEARPAAAEEAGTGRVQGPDLRALLDHLPGFAYRSRLDRSVELASAGALQLTGHRPEDLEEGRVSLGDLVHPEDRSRVAEALTAALLQPGPFQLTYRLLTAEGAPRWVWEVGRVVPGEDGQPRALEGFLTDVTGRKEAEERLLYDALHDNLTGLANRALLMERLKAAISRRQRRPQRSFALVCLDLDRFKVINDSLGHEAGDQVLRITARRLEACLRQEDTVARLGGDHFAVLLDDIDDASDAVRVALRIGELLARRSTSGTRRSSPWPRSASLPAPPDTSTRKSRCATPRSP